MKEENNRQAPSPLVSFISGGLAGSVSKTATAPLERLKVLIQVRHPTYKGLSVPRAAFQILQTEGLAGWFKGNGAVVLRIFPYAAIQFWVYEHTKHALLGLHPDPLYMPLVNLACGASAGVAGTLATYPLDIVHVRLAVQVGDPDYLGVRHALAKIYRQEGLHGFTKGLTATLAGIIPYAGINFATFELLKKWYSDYNHINPADIPIPAKLVCGGLAGACGQTVSYPINTVRRIQQISAQGFRHGYEDPHFHKHSIATAIRSIMAKEGIRGLFRGVMIHYYKSAPAVAVSFTCYEQFKKWGLRIEESLR